MTVSDKQGRLPYVAPELREQGSVAELTKYSYGKESDGLYGTEVDVEGPPGSSQ